MQEKQVGVQVQVYIGSEFNSAKHHRASDFGHPADKKIVYSNTELNAYLSEWESKGMVCFAFLEIAGEGIDDQVTKSPSSYPEKPQGLNLGQVRRLLRGEEKDIQEHKPQPKELLKAQSPTPPPEPFHKKSDRPPFEPRPSAINNQKHRFFRRDP